MFVANDVRIQPISTEICGRVPIQPGPHANCLKPLTVVPKCPFVVSDDDPTLPLWARLKILARATSFRKETHKNLEPAQNRYRLHHNRHV